MKKNVLKYGHRHTYLSKIVDAVYIVFSMCNLLHRK